MKPFALLIAFEVLEYILPFSRQEQLAIRRRLLRIRDFPANHTDYTETDDEKRLLNVHVFGKHAIRYWIDDADRHIKIMKILPSDQEE